MARLLASIVASVLVGTFFAVSSLPSTTKAQTPPAQLPVVPAALQQQVVDAINRGDPAGILGFFTDNAVIQGFPDCSVPCVGRQAVQREFETIVAAHVQVTLTNTQASGSSVTSRFEATSDYLQSIGVERIVGSFVSEVSGTKIASSSFQIDPNDAQSARFLALYAGTSPPTQGLLPDTGARSLPARRINWSAVAGAIAGFGLLTFLAGSGGLVLLRRRSDK